MNVFQTLLELMCCGSVAYNLINSLAGTLCVCVYMYVCVYTLPGCFLKCIDLYFHQQ